MEEKEISVKPFFIKCFIIEAVCVLIVLLSVVSVKFFSPKTFSKIKRWHQKNVMDQTSVSEVLKEVTDYEI